MLVRFLTAALFSSVLLNAGHLPACDDARYVRTPVPSWRASARPASIRTMPNRTPDPSRIVHTGDRMQLSGFQMGIEIGPVSLKVQGLALQCEVESWSDQAIVFRIPSLQLEKETRVSLVIETAGGQTLLNEKVRLRQSTQGPEPTSSPSPTLAPAPLAPSVISPTLDLDTEF